MKAIIFTPWFEAPNELDDFCKSIGYQKPKYMSDFNLMFDERVVQFCEKRLNRLWNEMVYKGRSSHKFRCGFAGAGYIRDIDISRTWRLQYDKVDAPIICYVDIKVNDYGYASIIPQRTTD